MDRLSKIRIEGFKSIRKADLELGPISVLIGANGSGKSNFISLFDMLANITKGHLRRYVMESGYSDSLLYYGSEVTQEMLIGLTFEAETGISTYEARLTDTSEAILYFSDEQLYFQKTSADKKEAILNNSSGREETNLISIDLQNEKAEVIVNLMRNGIQSFHFHDTSEKAPIRRPRKIEYGKVFHHNADNLAAYLYKFRKTNDWHYKKIVDTIRLVAPFFHDFELEPEDNAKYIKLKWREFGSDYLFEPHQHSDGLLRFISLATLLLQPEENLPDLIIIDEPELGLHPSAINVLGGMIRSASHFSQIIIATQSVSVVDQFGVKDIVVLERKKINDKNEFATKMKKLDPKELESWLEDYTLGELWEKNIFGGRP